MAAPARRASTRSSGCSRATRATALHARVRTLVGPALERLGWEDRPGDGDRDRELRGVLIGALANLGGDADASARVAELFQRYCADPSSVEANVAAAVVRATAATGGDRTSSTSILDRFRHGATPQEELRFLYALADVRDPEQMARVLELSMTPRCARRTRPSSSAPASPTGTTAPLAWKLVHERWDEMNERFPSNSIVRMLSGIRSVSDPALAADIEAFTAEHPVPQAKQTLQQHLERMRVSVGLRERTSGSAASC